MTEPATDEEIARQRESGHYDIASLLARIRAEQAEKATAREQAIRECAEIADMYKPLGTPQTWEHVMAAKAIYNCILSLLPKEQET